MDRLHQPYRAPLVPGLSEMLELRTEAQKQAAAVRAAGAAIGRNPVSILVPCHRVLGRDGTLTGYAGGLERKRALLAQYKDSGKLPPPRTRSFTGHKLVQDSPVEASA